MAEQHGFQHWRACAHEARAKSDRLNGADCKRIMLGIARGYDRMAATAVLIEESAALLRTARIKSLFALTC
jgi:hypothetical protein